MKNLTKVLLLPALALPLTAGTCTSDKVVDLVIGLPTEAEFVSSGETNTHDDTNTVDLRQDLDVPGALEDADVEAADIKSIRVVQVFYKITVPEPGRSIDNGLLEFTRVGVPGGPHLLVSGFSADVSQATDWIDVTEHLQPGINQINDFLSEYLAELQGTGPPVANTQFLYHIHGDSTPASVPTNFQWRVKIVIQATAAREFEVPFG